MRAATVVQQSCKSCWTCFKFYCMFYFTCDRSFSYSAEVMTCDTRRPRGGSNDRRDRQTSHSSSLPRRAPATLSDVAKLHLRVTDVTEHVTFYVHCTHFISDTRIPAHTVFYFLPRSRGVSRNRRFDVEIFMQTGRTLK